LYYNDIHILKVNNVFCRIIVFLRSQLNEMKYLFLTFLLFSNYILCSQTKSPKLNKQDLMNKVDLQKEKITGKVRITNNKQPEIRTPNKIEAITEKTANTIDEKLNETFEDFKNGFIEKLWEINPTWASHMGYHRFDATLELPNNSNRNRKLKVYQQFKDELETMPQTALSPSNQTDYALIQNFLNSEQWYINEYRSYEWNPSIYNLGGAFDAVLQNKNDKPEVLLKKISKKLEAVPKYYQLAKENLKNATIEHTELALKQIPGSLSIFENEIMDKINEADLKAGSQIEIMRNLKAAIEAIKEFANWLESDYAVNLKSTGNARSFRLGKAQYAKKFQFDINSQFTAEHIYERALTEKAATLQKMEALSKKLWSTYFPDESMPATNFVAPVIKKISKDHTDRDNFIEAIKQQIPQLKAFVEEKDLVYLDPDKPLEIRETPKYMAGVAGASISSPGPYEKDGETYYNVTPLTNYSNEEAESYLREYNNYMLQILNIHEAIPGHYTQLVEANKAPSLVKSIFGNGTMIEGWACYTERMMLEEGYGNHQPELWLMYYKWLLRIISNTILDYGLHNLNLSEADALNLLVNEAFQEETEAREKIKRAKLTQVQLCSYYTGLSEILDLRTDFLNVDNNSLRSFHDTFLSFGSAPVKEIRKLMKLE